jgi:hypothetical protein
VAIYVAFAWYTWNRTLIPDELWELTNAQRPWWDWLARIRADLNHPPLRYALERLWIGLFGLSDFTAKLLSLLTNVLALALFPFVAARATPRWKVASLLFLTLYLHVFSSVNLARMYGLIVLLTVAALWAWDEWRMRPTTRRLAIWSALMCLAVMTHFFGTLLLASFVLVVWSMGPHRKAFTAAAAIPALLFGAWVAYLYPVYAAGGLKGVAWVESSLVRSMLVVPFQFLTTVPSGWNPIQDTWWTTLPARPWFIQGVALINVLLFLLAWRGIRDRRNGAWLFPAFILTVGPAVMLACMSFLVGPVFNARFLLGSIPIYWILIVVLSDLGGLAARTIVTGVMLPAAIVSVLLPLPHDVAESPLRADVAYIAQHRKPGDVILADNPTGPIVYWELRRSGLEIPLMLRPVAPAWNTLSQQPAIADAVWVFCLDTKCSEPIESLLREHGLTQRGQYGKYLALYGDAR